MDRRSFLGSTLSAAALEMGPSPADQPAQEDARPPFDVERSDANRWRIRSWGWRDNAWRPLIAHATRGTGGFMIEGPVATGDRRAVTAWLEAQPSG